MFKKDYYFIEIILSMNEGKISIYVFIKKIVFLKIKNYFLAKEKFE